ncbi:MAG: hypothetical protein EBZ13_14695, partial [Planctomycetia bacterium]|nr:hypothetical protein [Planctomycetia bacterium]
MADTNAAAGPGVIVVAEERVHSLLANADIAWNVQERQQGVASMWQGLSSGALDQRSRILIFSDSLLVGTANDDRERRQTAQALVMMAKAGAVAGIVQWREESWHEFEGLIAEVALKEADEILFVTTLASTAVQGMARALREITAPVDESGLGVPREKIGIIVNQSVANVGMEREQVLAAGLGVPVVGVIPLATKDVLTATNLNRMHELLTHPLIG